MPLEDILSHSCQVLLSSSAAWASVQASSSQEMQQLLRAEAAAASASLPDFQDDMRQLWPQLQAAVEQQVYERLIQKLLRSCTLQRALDALVRAAVARLPDGSSGSGSGTQHSGHRAESSALEMLREKMSAAGFVAGQTVGSAAKDEQQRSALACFKVNYSLNRGVQCTELFAKGVAFDSKRRATKLHHMLLEALFVDAVGSAPVLDLQALQVQALELAAGAASEVDGASAVLLQLLQAVQAVVCRPAPAACAAAAAGAAGGSGSQGGGSQQAQVLEKLRQLRSLQAVQTACGCLERCLGSWGEAEKLVSELRPDLERRLYSAALDVMLPRVAGLGVDQRVEVGGWGCWAGWCLDLDHGIAA